MYSARPTLLTDTLTHVKLSPGEGTQREGNGSALTVLSPQSVSSAGSTDNRHVVVLRVPYQNVSTISILLLISWQKSLPDYDASVFKLHAHGDLLVKNCCCGAKFEICPPHTRMVHPFLAYILLCHHVSSSVVVYQ